MFLNSLVNDAYQRIRNSIVLTPCIFSPSLSSISGADVYLKMESMQRTGAFKDRGALNFLLARNSKRPVVAASAGNHAQAVAMHAHRLNVKATIFMPISTPNIKVAQTEAYQADVKLVGENYDEAYQAAQAFCRETGAEYLHAYNDLDVIIGQGTIALEIQQQVGKPDMVFVPVGGGGLIAGIAKYFLNEFGSYMPLMVGVEASAFQSMANALNKGKAKAIGQEKSIAEGISVRDVGGLTSEICREVRPTMVSVDDNQIESAIMLLLEKQKIVTEGAGAAATAGFLLGQFSEVVKNKKVVIIVSGANIDVSLLSRLTGQELIKLGRLCRISLVINDTPGSLAKLLRCLTTAKANIVEIQHERYFVELRWNEVMVHVTLETKSQFHEQKMLEILFNDGYQIIPHRWEKVGATK